VAKLSFLLNKSKTSVVAILFFCVFLSFFHPVALFAYSNDSSIVHFHFDKTNETAEQENICTLFCHFCSGFCTMYIPKTNSTNFHTARAYRALSLSDNLISKENKNDIFKPPKN
jgi:hypothetical protein